jgi:hypothetical protein
MHLTFICCADYSALLCFPFLSFLSSVSLLHRSSAICESCGEEGGEGLQGGQSHEGRKGREEEQRRVSPASLFTFGCRCVLSRLALPFPFLSPHITSYPSLHLRSDGPGKRKNTDWGDDEDDPEDPEDGPDGEGDDEEEDYEGDSSGAHRSVDSLLNVWCAVLCCAVLLPSHPALPLSLSPSLARQHHFQYPSVSSIPSHTYLILLV